MNRGGPLERRAPLTARTALPRGGPLARVRQLAQVAPVRARTPQARPKARTGEFPRGVRAQLWARCDGLCEVCGQPLPVKGWTAQHRRARGMGGTRREGTTTAANGLAVHDRPCHHEVIEANPNRALDMGWRVPQFDDPETVPLWLPGGRRVLLSTDGRYVDVP